MKKKIFLSSPHMSGDEMSFINEAFETNWIAPLGKNVIEFENEMCAYIGRANAVALSSGSAAIHMGLKYLGVKENDIVFCSSFTFSGSCNPIDYCKATPVFIDSDYQTYNMSPIALAKAYEKYPNPAAVIIVNLYGNPADYDELLKITKKHGTPVLEDSAESLGATYKGVQTGNFGDISVFSFNGNKIITTSGGGMAMVNDKTTHDKILFWSTQSRENCEWYQHNEIGYNYRLSNVCAGIGRGQLLHLDKRVAQKTEIFNTYKKCFENCPYIQLMPSTKDSVPNHWLTVITLRQDCVATYMDIIKELAKNSIESRPSWKPMHKQPVFENCDFFSTLDCGSVCEDLFSRSLCLPSDSKMTYEDTVLVSKIVLDTIYKLQEENYV